MKDVFKKAKYGLKLQGDYIVFERRTNKYVERFEDIQEAIDLLVRLNNEN